MAISPVTGSPQHINTQVAAPAVTPAVAAALHGWGFRLPEYTKASDAKLYPSNQELGYGTRLEVSAEDPTRFGLIETSDGRDFHRVVLERAGEARYHPHSTLGEGLKPDRNGALQLPVLLSRAITVPMKRGETIALAVPSRTGNLLDTVKVSARGVSKQVSYELKATQVHGSTVHSLVEISATRAAKLRAESKFTPARSTRVFNVSNFEPAVARPASDNGYWAWRLSDRHPSQAKESLFVR